MKILRLPLAVWLIALAFLPLMRQASAEKPQDVRTTGEVAFEKGIYTVKGAKATLVIGNADSDTYRFTAEVKPADKATGVYLQVMPSDTTNPNKPAPLYHLLPGRSRREAQRRHLPVGRSPAPMGRQQRRRVVQLLAGPHREVGPRGAEGQRSRRSTTGTRPTCSGTAGSTSTAGGGWPSRCRATIPGKSTPGPPTASGAGTRTGWSITRSPSSGLSSNCPRRCCRSRPSSLRPGRRST
jgi:hypothetical protein